MKKLKFYFLILVGILFLSAVFYILRKRYEGRQRFAIAAEKVKTLTENNKIRDGDIIFQTSISKQSKAIAMATHSQYTHCGIIFSFDTGTSKYYVIEAAAKVKWTPLDKWIAKGQGDHFVVKRVEADPAISLEMFGTLRTICQSYIGRDYDPYFSWSDDKIYCSELVWKAYHKLNNLELGKLQLLKDFDLSDEVVKDKLEERYGNKIPLTDTVISPASIFNCSLLKEVDEE